MKTVERFGPGVAALLGGAVAAYAIRESEVQDYVVAADDGVRALLVTPQWAGTVAAVVAAGMLSLLTRFGTAILAVLTSTAGAIVIGLPAVIAVSTEPSVTLNAVGAGLLLASGAYQTVGRHGPLLAFAAGVLGTNLFFTAAGLWRTREARWSISLPGDPFYVPPTVPPLMLIATVLVIGGVAIYARSPRTAGESDRREILVGLALPLAYVLLYAVLGSTTAGAVSWTIAVVLAVTTTIATALWLPERESRFLLAGLAMAAVSVNGLRYFDGAWWLVLIGIALLGLGAAVGWRRSMPGAGLMALAVVTATGLLSANATFDIVATLAYTLALPFSLGLVVASCLPARTLVAVTGSMLPLTMTFFAISAPIDREFGWSNGVPEPDDYPLVAVVSPSPIGVIFAVATAALAALVAARRAKVTLLPTGSQ